MIRLYLCIAAFTYGITQTKVVLADDGLWHRHIDTVREAYKDFRYSDIPIEHPIAIISATSFFDGGTIQLRFEDVKNRSYQVVLKVLPTAGKLAEFRLVYVSRYFDAQLSIGTMGRTSGELRNAVIRGPEESVVYAALINWERAQLIPVDSKSSPVEHRLAHRLLEALDFRYGFTDGIEPIARYSMEWPDLDFEESTDGNSETWDLKD